MNHLTSKSSTAAFSTSWGAARSARGAALRRPLQQAPPRRRESARALSRGGGGRVKVGACVGVGVAEVCREAREAFVSCSLIDQRLEARCFKTVCACSCSPCFLMYTSACAPLQNVLVFNVVWISSTSVHSNRRLVSATWFAVTPSKMGTANCHNKHNSYAWVAQKAHVWGVVTNPRSSHVLVLRKRLDRHSLVVQAGKVHRNIDTLKPSMVCFRTSRTSRCSV